MKHSVKEIITYVFTLEEVVEMLAAKTGAKGDPVVTGIDGDVELTFELEKAKAGQPTGRPARVP